MSFLNKMSKSDTDSSGLYLTNRHMSWLLSFLLFFSFFVFMVGYFLGKKVATQELMQEIEESSLEDAHAVMSYQQDTATENQKVATHDTMVTAQKEVIQEKKEEPTAPVAPAIQRIAEMSQQPVTRYYAELIGFGTQQAAQSFAEKLQRKGVPVEVKKRSSKSAKGRLITWYQIVTKPYSDKKEITQLVKKVCRQEHLADVRILTC
jgi:predicted phage tail protein